MPANQRFARVIHVQAIVLLSIAVASCSRSDLQPGQSARILPNSAVPPSRLGDLPPVAGLDALTEARFGGGTRSTSWFGDFLWDSAMDFVQWISGAHWVAASADAVEVGETGELNASPAEPFKFAVYAVPSANLIGQDGATFIVANIVANDGAALIGQDGAAFLGKGAAAARGASALPNPLDAVQGVHNFALANFALGYWVFVDAADDGLINLADQLGAVADYVSPAGYAYVAPLLWSPDEDAQMRITGFTGLAHDPADTTPGPALDGFALSPVRGGLHVQWTDPAVSEPLIVMVHYSRHSFAAPDEAGVVTLNYPIKNAEAVFTSPMTGLHYVMAQTLNLRSGQSGPLTAPLTATPIPGDPLVMELSADPAEADTDQTVTFTATGAQTYDWDLDEDGAFEILGEATGVQALPDGTPGTARVAVRGHDDDNGLAWRSATINRRGWVYYVLDNEVPCGDNLQLLRLADGRLAAMYASYIEGNQHVRYAIADNSAPIGSANWSYVEVQAMAPGVAINGMDMQLINGRPAAAARLDNTMHYFYSDTPDGALATDWHTATVATGVGTGLEELVSLAQADGRPAIAYHGAVSDETTGTVGDTCEALIFNRALDAGGSSWGPGVEVDSRNITSGADYCPLDMDMEIIAGYPAFIYSTSPSAMWDYTTRYAYCSTADGSGAWNRSVLLDDRNPPLRGTALVDCGGAPGFVYMSNSGGDVLQFGYGANSVNGGPGAPWQFSTIEPLGLYYTLVAKVYDGEPWLCYTDYYTLKLRSAPNADGSGVWTSDDANPGSGGAMHMDFVADGQGPSAVAYANWLSSGWIGIKLRY